MYTLTDYKTGNIFTCKIKQEFRRIVLCHQLWLKTEADEIQKDKSYAGHK